MEPATQGNCCLCGEDAKYRCPTCLRQTCSVRCVAKHKEQHGCSGRKHISYIPVSDMTAETLSKDVALLDEVSRVIESTSRAFVQRQLEASTTAARRVNERVKLSRALERVLSRLSDKSEHSEALREYFVPSNVVALLRDMDSPNTSPRHFMCDLECTVRQNLEKTKILEFPRIEIVLKRDLDTYQLAERRTAPAQVVEGPCEGLSSDVTLPNPASLGEELVTAESSSLS
ncbi:Box C/D snoRNA protein 1 [Babesia sp. Xinjiang]|uniref:Box C/D snoRNA protein 1 n=1 Tax=Babesia sp. Xinjiang TaxID=462227 RepID=UPI000A24184C|nr:Box C/D snoRNA protein 1 [Babesia sp. Xinjiang]ORM40329.1 Box C/D snoRNA protein 1 [Babesia sp. Xinjiang]